MAGEGGSACDARVVRRLKVDAEGVEPCFDRVVATAVGGDLELELILALSIAEANGWVRPRELEGGQERVLNIRRSDLRTTALLVELEGGEGGRP